VLSGFRIDAFGLVNLRFHDLRDTKPTNRKSAFLESMEKAFQNASSTPLKDFQRPEMVAQTICLGELWNIEVAQNQNTFYVAAASGGVWKTEDNGQSLSLRSFDHQGANWESAIWLFRHPIIDILWVGTGEIIPAISKLMPAQESYKIQLRWAKTGRYGLASFISISARFRFIPTKSGSWFGLAPLGWLLSKKTKSVGLYKTTDGGKSWGKTFTL